MLGKHDMSKVGRTRGSRRYSSRHIAKRAFFERRVVSTLMEPRRFGGGFGFDLFFWEEDGDERRLRRRGTVKGAVELLMIGGFGFSRVVVVGVDGGTVQVLRRRGVANVDKVSSFVGVDVVKCNRISFPVGGGVGVDSLRRGRLCVAFEGDNELTVFGCGECDEI